MSRATIGGLRAEIAALAARVAQVEQERDTAVSLLQWYAESRRRWMETVDRGSRYIYGQTGARLHGPRETMPVPEIGCIDRPDLRRTPVEYERSEAAQDLDDYARDINSW